MVVRFRKCVLKIDEIRKDEISLESFLDHEREVIRLIRWWKNSEAELQFKTSGSTGEPKEIDVSRWKIEYSVDATMDKLDPTSNFRSSLLCINPKMVGGAMVVFRALRRDLDLTVLPPTSNPSLLIADNQQFDLVSLVPMQMHETNSEFWNRFNTILVGGADFQEGDMETSARVFGTFGMTETVSHFALREVGQNSYECTGDIKLEKRTDQRLKIKGTLTDDEWLLTNDLVEFISPERFKWKGRTDFIINSGGYKINPEKIERKLSGQINFNFIAASIPDNRLGNKLILIVEADTLKTSLDYSGLLPHEKPKEIYFLAEFAKTASSKVNRIKTLDLLKLKLKA